jgi:Transmembrane family, TMEM144 of transporters
MSVFEECSDSCGWTAALIALFAAGTYGVPIKETHSLTDLNPFIFQSFKTMVFVITSLSVLQLGNVPCTFTPWGILSGLLWVLGGTGGVVAVRMAGLAVAVGTWASVMICVNFVWGILVFREPVANMQNTVSAFVLLGLGLVGMSKYGAPPPSSTTTTNESNEGDDKLKRVDSCDDDANEEQMESGDNDRANLIVKSKSVVLRRTGMKSDETAVAEVLLDTSSRTATPMEIDANTTTSSSAFNPESHVRVCGIILSKRAAGIMAALFNGLMSGSSLIPMHYAKRHGFGGANYIISYATGALLSNIGIWIIYYTVLVVRLYRKHGDDEISWKATLQKAAGSMPEWHFQQLWKPALAAGT